MYNYAYILTLENFLDLDNFYVATTLIHKFELFLSYQFCWLYM